MNSTGVIMIPLDSIVPDPKRHTADRLVDQDELAASIYRGGLHQPITVFSARPYRVRFPALAQQLGGAAFVLCFGFRRLTAFQKLRDRHGDKFAQIPAYVRDDLLAIQPSVLGQELEPNPVA
jgi:hypothetical protein